MSVESWTTIWGLLLAASLVVFALLSLVVTIVGLGDIRALFRGIEDAHRREEPNEPAQR